jgi:hypothetical protein
MAVRFPDCTDVRVRDVHIENLPAWTLHLRSCEDVPVHNVRISDSDIMGGDDVPDGTVEALGNRARALENTLVYGKPC